MIERKSDQVRRLVREGDYKAALRIASNFKLGISEEDRDAMKRGYECMNFPVFYQSIGKDPVEFAKKAEKVVQRLYG